MKHFRFAALIGILLLALFPAVLYAATSHEGHGAAPAAPIQDISAPAAGQSMINQSGSDQSSIDHSKMDHSKMDYIIISGQGAAVTPGNQSTGQTGSTPSAEKTASGGSHDGHGAAPAAAPKASSAGSHDQHGSASGSQKSSDGDHQSGGHGGESKPNVLEPVKNGIVAGFAIFNGLVIIAAIFMKKKLGQGV